MKVAQLQCRYDFSNNVRICCVFTRAYILYKLYILIENVSRVNSLQKIASAKKS